MALRTEFGDTKVCKDCSIEKPLTEYYKARSRSTHHSYCKECVKQRNLIWKKSNPDKMKASLRKSRLKNEYGLTDEDIAIVDSINFCEICHSDKNLVVDHCHDRVVYRGVVCSNCNKALGFAGDSVERLEKMIDYLRRNK